MKNKTIVVNVDKNKEIIDELIKIALKNDFLIDGLHAPPDAKRISKKIKKEMEFWINNCGGYSSKLLKFSREKNIFEINFLRFLPENWRNIKMFNVNKKEELNQAIAWIKNEKPLE